MGVFDGLKILELGSGAAAPVAARYFTEQGAHVIRIESATRPDFLRVLSLTPDNPHGLNGAPMFILLNPNKDSVAIDLTVPEGVDVVKRLVGWADVVSENFSPGVMAKFGLDYESLAAIKPELVMVSGCLYGQTGPQRKYPGFGGQSSAIAGFNHVTGWPDREALGPFGTITDSLAPRYVALAITAALIECRRTGQGQFIDAAQIEIGVYSLSEIVVRCSANDDTIMRNGNRHESAAPHGVYPCAGDERFIAIAAMNDAQWRSLAAVVDDEAWTADSRFDTLAGRLEHRDEIDEELAAWTGERDAHALMAELQAAGVEAGAVQNEADLLEDPQLAHRRHFRAVEHPHLGDVQLEHSAIRLADSPPHLDRAGPDLGADTDAILSDVLGLDVTEIERLRTLGALT